MREQVRTVYECCCAAVTLIGALDASWMDGEPLPQLSLVRTCADLPAARNIVNRAIKLVAPMLDGASGERRDTSEAMPKWRAMSILASQLFLRLGVLAEGLSEEDQDIALDHDCMALLRGSVDAAMGMVEELNEAEWVEGRDMPPGVLAALKSPVLSLRLECAGPLAVTFVQRIYCIVVKALAEEELAWRLPALH